MAMMYDKYAADLYGYCHWMLHDSADAAGALKDTFVIAATTLSDLSEPSKLRPWLFALARNECRRRIRPTSAARDEETDAANQRADDESPSRPRRAERRLIGRDDTNSARPASRSEAPRAMTIRRNYAEAPDETATWSRVLAASGTIRRGTSANAPGVSRWTMLTPTRSTRPCQIRVVSMPGDATGRPGPSRR